MVFDFFVFVCICLYLFVFACIYSYSFVFCLFASCLVVGFAFDLGLCEVVGVVGVVGLERGGNIFPFDRLTLSDVLCVCVFFLVWYLV